MAGYHFDLGTYTRPVSTASPAAQAWFDRGLLWSYGFNHEEAVRCFEVAVEHDPGCALAHWGIAYAVGPNYNKDWDAFDAVDLQASLRRAHAAVSRRARGRSGRGRRRARPDRRAGEAVPRARAGRGLRAVEARLRRRDGRGPRAPPPRPRRRCALRRRDDEPHPLAAVGSRDRRAGGGRAHAGDQAGAGAGARASRAGWPIPACSTSTST